MCRISRWTTFSTWSRSYSASKESRVGNHSSSWDCRIGSLTYSIKLTSSLQAIIDSRYFQPVLWVPNTLPTSIFVFIRFPSSSWSCQCPWGCGSVVKRKEKILVIEFPYQMVPSLIWSKLQLLPGSSKQRYKYADDSCRQQQTCKERTRLVPAQEMKQIVRPVLLPFVQTFFCHTASLHKRSKAFNSFSSFQLCQ